MTGHSAASVNQMLEKHYLPYQQQISDQAMDKLERKKLTFGPGSKTAKD